MLKYTGGGFIPDVPARNLTDDEVKALPVTKTQLLRSGLFVEEKSPKNNNKKPVDKEIEPSTGESGEGN